MLAQARYGVVILAAGGATRMGKAKQILPYKDSTLLGNAVREAGKIHPETMVVVTGAYPEVADGLGKMNIVHNAQWKAGIGTSISLGVSEIIKTHAGLDGIFILSCDQPFLTARVLNALMAQKVITGKAIAACVYGGTMGTPVLFGKGYFKALVELHGDEGAKKILLANPLDIASVIFDEGEFDIDTEEDYRALLARSSD